MPGIFEDAITYHNYIKYKFGWHHCDLWVYLFVKFWMNLELHFRNCNSDKGNVLTTDFHGYSQSRLWNGFYLKKLLVDRIYRINFYFF